MATQEDDVFEPLAENFRGLRLEPGTARGAREPTIATPVVATLVAFDLDDRPVIRYREFLPGERVAGRTTVPLKRAQLGSDVVVVCESGDARRPIVMGVIEAGAARSRELTPASLPTVVQVDGDRQVITAEREIVLRCGNASITLTRAGKVIIKGTYVLSRSSGYNRIKGAAVDIN